MTREVKLEPAVNEALEEYLRYTGEEFLPMTATDHLVQFCESRGYIQAARWVQGNRGNGLYYRVRNEFTFAKQ